MDHVFALTKASKAGGFPKATVTNLGPQSLSSTKSCPPGGKRSFPGVLWSWKCRGWVDHTPGSLRNFRAQGDMGTPPNCVSSKNKPWNHETSLKLGKQTHLEGNVEICDRSRSCVFVANSNFISDSRPLASWSSVSTLLLYWDIFLSNLTGGVAGRCLKEIFAQPKREMVAEKWLIGIFC